MRDAVLAFNEAVADLYAAPTTRAADTLLAELQLATHGRFERLRRQQQRPTTLGLVLSEADVDDVAEERALEKRVNVETRGAR